jgi:hypothetical protein
MRLKPIPIAVALGALGAAWLVSPPSLAMNVKPVNLTDLVRQSDQIVTGTVTGVSQGTDEHGLPYTQVQVKVAESIRGGASGTLTFRQFGLQTAQPASNGRKLLGLVAGMPRYTKNDQVALFLTRTSTLGLRTTIGLDQGRFVLRGGNYENGANNSGLFKDVDFSKVTLNAKEKFLTTTQIGAVSADAFLGLVRRAVNENWWVPAAPPKTPIQPLPKKLRAGSASGVLQ